MPGSKTLRQMIWRQVTPVRSVTFTLGNQLMLSGCRLRHRNQMPVVTGGQDQTVRAVVGSIRELTIRNGALCGNLRWASDPEAQAVREKYEAGILRFQLDVVELEVSGSTVTRWMPVGAILEASR
jgi:hypothetical protein